MLNEPKITGLIELLTDGGTLPRETLIRLSFLVNKASRKIDQNERTRLLS